LRRYAALIVSAEHSGRPCVTRRNGSDGRSGTRAAALPEGTQRVETLGENSRIQNALHYVNFKRRGKIKFAEDQGVLEQANKLKRKLQTMLES
jgi:hypothetical protein